MPDFDFDSLKNTKEEAIKENAKKDDNISLMQDVFGVECENERNILAEKTKKSRKEIDAMIDTVKNELKGLISTEGAIFIAAKRLGIDWQISKPKKEEKDAFESVPSLPSTEKGDPLYTTKKIEKPQPKITKPQPPPQKEESYPIEIVPSNIEAIQNQKYTLAEKKQLIHDTVELYKYMVDSVLDKTKDYHTYKNGKVHIKRSGCTKLATAFSISTETLSIDVEYEYDKDGNIKDIHAHAKVKAERQDGSYVISMGTKSKSEYFSEKYQNYGSYNLHNLKITAETKASNHAILNAIGFAEVSYEEVERPDDNQKDAFGGE